MCNGLILKSHDPPVIRPTLSIRQRLVPFESARRGRALYLLDICRLNYNRKLRRIQLLNPIPDPKKYPTRFLLTRHIYPYLFRFIQRWVFTDIHFFEIAQRQQ